MTMKEKKKPEWVVRTVKPFGTYHSLVLGDDVLGGVWVGADGKVHATTIHDNHEHIHNALNIDDGKKLVIRLLLEVKRKPKKSRAAKRIGRGVPLAFE